MAEKADKSFEPVGLSVLLDKVEADKVIQKLLPHALIQNVKIVDFSYEASEYPKLTGKKFQVLLVTDEPGQIPFLAVNETTGIKKTAIYVRRHASTEEATYEECRKFSTAESPPVTLPRAC